MKYRLDLPPPEVLTTKEEVQALYESLMAYDEVVAYDTETSGLEWDATVYMIQFAYRPSSHPLGRRVLVPTYSPAYFVFYDILRPWFEDPEKPKFAQNAPYDYRLMANHGIEVRGLRGDTMKMHHLFDEEGDHGLKTIAKKMCGLNLKGFKEVFGKKMTRKLVVEVFEDPERQQAATDYATLDPWATLEVGEMIQERLATIPWEGAPESLAAIGVPKKPTRWDQHVHLDVPFIQVLQNIERRGVPFDAARLSQLAEPMVKDARDITRELCSEYNVSVNLSSPKQVSEFLFGTLGLKPKRKTSTGWSVDQKTMEALLREGHEVARQILDYRKIIKIKGTYVEGLLKHIAHDGRIHTSLRATTVTNRLRSSQPNLLNLPNADRDVYKIREAVVAPPGYIIVCVDYSGLEMRLAAAMFGDDGLIQAISDGMDLHSMTAAMMYGLDYEEIIAAKKASDPTKAQKALKNYRSSAKTTGFGINYGIGPQGLAIQLTGILGRIVSTEEAKDAIEMYLEARPGIREGINYYKKMLWETGTVSTILGRTRTPHGTYHSSYADRSSAERQAINFPIQGTAADLIQLAMMEAEYDSTLADLGAEMILQIHDELLFLAPEENGDSTMARVKEIMENPRGWPGLPYDVPVEAEGGTSYTWADAK